MNRLKRNKRTRQKAKKARKESTRTSQRNAADRRVINKKTFAHQLAPSDVTSDYWPLTIGPFGDEEKNGN